MTNIPTYIKIHGIKRKAVHQRSFQEGEQMMKQKKGIIISLLFIFTVGILCGYLAANSVGTKEKPVSDNQETPICDNNEFADIQKKELSIDPDFFEVDALKYNHNHLNTKIHLTEKGRLYNATELFSTEYTVSVTLVNNQFDEPYLFFDNIVWDINEDLNIDLVIDTKEINDKDMLSDFNKQLELMKSGKEHNIMYRVEVVSQLNPNNTMRTIGMLYEK